jgi:hypothetical protein
MTYSGLTYLVDITGSYVPYWNYDRPGTTVSVIENDMSQIRMYPNPVIDELNIDGLSGDETIQLFDITGKLLRSFENYNSTCRLNLKTLDDGVYFVQTISENTNRTYKIVKRN